MFNRYAIAVAIVIGVFVVPAHALDWTGLIDNRWSIPGNWNPAGPPAPANDARIGPDPAAFGDVVLLDTDPTITGLLMTNDTELLVTGAHNLTITGNAVLDQTAGTVKLTIDAGSLLNTNTLRVRNGAELLLLGGTLNVAADPMNIGPGSELRADLGGATISAVDLVLDGVFNAVDATTDINATSVTVNSTGNFNVASKGNTTTVNVNASFIAQNGSQVTTGSSLSTSTLVLGDAGFQNGSATAIYQAGVLQLDGTVNFFPLSTLSFRHDDAELVVNGHTTIGIGTFTWEGFFGGSRTSVGPGAVLDLSVGTLAADNGYGGDLTIDSGTVNVQTTAGDWFLRDSSQVTLTNSGGGTPTIAGDTVELNGPIAATGVAAITAESKFGPTVDVSLPSSGDELRLSATSFEDGSYSGNGKLTLQSIAKVIDDTVIDSGLRTESASAIKISAGKTLTLVGKTEYAGGTHGVSGNIVQTGDTVVSASTTISTTGNYDWDGASETSKITVNNGQQFTISVGSLETVHNGTIQLDGGTLSVNNTGGTSWEAAGSIQLNTATKTGGAKPTITGSENLVVSGTVNAAGSGGALIAVPVDMKSTAVITADEGSFLDFGVATTDAMRLYGATFAGSGTFNLNGSVDVYADTVVNMDMATGVFDIGGDNLPGTPFTFHVHTGNSFVINAFAVDDEPGGFSSGTIDVRGSLTVNTPGPWRIGSGKIELTNVDPLEPFPTLNGVTLQVDATGTLCVCGGESEINAPVELYGTLHEYVDSVGNFNSSTVLALTSLAMDGPTSFINLNGPTQWAGGSYIGPGRIWQFGNAEVTAPTSIDVAAYKWDGAGGASSSTTTIRSGASLTLNVNSISPSNNYAGHVFVEDTATLTVNTSSASSWQLDGAATLEGPAVPTPASIIAGVDVTLGTKGLLEGNGQLFVDLTNNGTIRPGAGAGTLVVNGSFVQSATGALYIELGGLSPIVAYDQLNVTGTATLAGTLNVSLIGGYAPSVGNTFEVVTASGGVISAFDTEALAAIGGGLYLDLTYEPNTVLVSVLGVSGDYNLNGVVDAADYVVWRNSLGQSGAGLAADGNGDHLISQLDYDVWRSHYGQSAASGFGSLAIRAVPEPASVFLLLTGMLVLSRRCRAATSYGC